MLVDGIKSMEDEFRSQPRDLEMKCSSTQDEDEDDYEEG